MTSRTARRKKSSQRRSQLPRSRQHLSRSQCRRSLRVAVTRRKRSSNPLLRSLHLKLRRRLKAAPQVKMRKRKLMKK